MILGCMFVVGAAFDDQYRESTVSGGETGLLGRNLMPHL